MWRRAEVRMRRNVCFSPINNFEFFKICYGALVLKIGHCEYRWWHFRIRSAGKTTLLPSALFWGKWVHVVLGGCSRSYCDLGVCKMYPSFIWDVAWFPWQRTDQRISSATAFVLKMWVCCIETDVLGNTMIVLQILCVLMYNFIHKKNQVNSEKWTQPKIGLHKTHSYKYTLQTSSGSLPVLTFTHLHLGLQLSVLW